MIKDFDVFLHEEFSQLGKSKVLEAMEYSLFSSGKRLRVLMVLSMLKDMGVDEKKGYYAAAALECIHTYSLIHDDLPALDNDDVRRFKPTNHIVYGEGLAILAGDGLLTLAFYFLSKGEYNTKVFEVLSYHAGINGMILGQEYDILETIDSLEALERCYLLKTGGLFAAGLQMAGIIAGRENLDTLQDLAYKLGIVFQHQDDLLEVVSTIDIGKSKSSDEVRDKATLLSYMEVDEALTYVDTMFTSIYETINAFAFETQYFMDLVKSISKRNI